MELKYGRTTQAGLRQTSVSYADLIMTRNGHVCIRLTPFGTTLVSTVEIKAERHEKRDSSAAASTFLDICMA